MNHDTNREDRNQCDGCMQGADTKLGAVSGSLLHIDRHGHAFMTCERELYAPTSSVTCLSCGATAESAEQLPCGH